MTDPQIFFRDGFYLGRGENRAYQGNKGLKYRRGYSRRAKAVKKASFAHLVGNPGMTPGEGRIFSYWSRLLSIPT